MSNSIKSLTLTDEDLAVEMCQRLLDDEVIINVQAVDDFGGEFSFQIASHSIPLNTFFEKNAVDISASAVFETNICDVFSK